MPPGPTATKFADFVLDQNRGELRKGGEIVKIRHQTLRLLCYFVNNQGRTVSRAELAKHLWSNADIDFDQRLNAAIRDLRKTLQDTSSDRPLVQTAPRQGYRFVSEKAPHRPSRPALVVAGVAVFLAIGAGAFAWFNFEDWNASAPAWSANEDYIEARSLLDAGKPDDHARVVALLESVVADVPEHADAWASLAKAYLHDAISPAEAFPRAGSAALKALAIDPDNVTALHQAATVAITWDRDWPQAETYLRHALEVAPDGARVYHAYAALLYLRGDFAAGAEMMARGLAIDPLSTVMNTDLVWYRTVSGDYEDAIRTCALLARINPDSQAAMSCAVYPNLLLGRVSEAAAIIRQQMHAQGAGAFAAEHGDTDILNRYWRMILDAVSRAAESRYVDPVEFARYYARLGDPEQTLQALEKAIADHSMFAPYIPLFPEFRGLHAHARFLELLADIGLPEAPDLLLARIRQQNGG